MFAELTVTDGTTYINLLNRNRGFHVINWRPALPGYKGGGVFQDSPLAHGRRLVARAFENVVDAFDLAVNGVDQNAVIRDLQELARLLEKGVDYWAADWQDEPVWLEARAIGETNKRYAIVHTWRLPEMDDPYGGAFVSQAMGMNNLTLVIEHGLWTSEAPGESACVEISAVETYCWPPHVEFNATTTVITVPDNAAIQDLHDDAMTVEAWIRPDSWGEGNNSIIMLKCSSAFTEGWLLLFQTGIGLRAIINCVTTDGEARSGVGDISPDSAWHHVAFTWDDTWGNTYPRLWIDGVESTYAGGTTNRNGAIVTDVGSNLLIGNRPANDFTFDGGIGWTRVSDVVRYSATFTPPPRCVLPAIDANTVGQWIGAEQSGATIDNQEGTAAIDGTLSNGTFDCDCEFQYGNVTGGCAPAFLEFNGATSIVTVSDAASIQDLHDDAMTVEAWIRPDSWGEGNNSIIMLKCSSAFTEGWLLLFQTGIGLRAIINCVTTDGEARSGVGDISPDSAWHHVAFTWNDTWGNTYPRLWIDGVESTYAGGTINRNGPIVTDVGSNLLIGNRPAVDWTFDGGIGWVRVSDTVRYSATFTPPVRCTLPAVDGNTVLLEIQEGVGATTYDQSGNGNDGAITAAAWGCDCSSSTIVRDPEC